MKLSQEAALSGLRPDSVSIRFVLSLFTYVICGLVALSVYEHVHLYYTLLFLTLSGLSLYFEYRGDFLIPRWALTLLSLVVVVVALYRFDLNELVTQMMEALLLLISIKLLEDKKMRDYMQIYAMSLFILAGLGLVSLSIVFLVYFISLIFLLTLSVVLLTFYAQDPDLSFPVTVVRKILGRALWIPLLAIPLTLVMFVILPRAQFPLLNFLNRDETARTGFTDNVRLGGVSGIQEDSSIILRVSMDRIDENHLFWRGIVLDYFDGSTWVSSLKNRLARLQPPDLSVRGRSVRQTIYLEPYGNIYLFSLDKPVLINIRGGRKNHDLTYSAFRFIDKRIRYDAISILSDRMYQADVPRDMYLQVPAAISPRIVELVGKLTAGKKGDDKIEPLLAHLAGGAYRYSLQNLPVSQNALEEFLFKARYGNCEYFASAFAIMCRIAGIPARLVGGYRGGYYNEVGGYYMVPQKNAHVWVEVHTSKGYWVRLDPTPGAADAFSALWRSDLLLRLRLFMDTVNYYWYALVINYNFEKQMSVIRKIKSGITKPNLKLSMPSRKAILSIMVALLAASSLWIILQGIRSRKNPEARLLERFLRRLEGMGYRKTATQGLEEFVVTLPEGPTRDSAFAFVRAFEEIYFRDRPLDAETRARLEAIITRLQP